MAYPQERKEAILKKLLPPVNKSVAEVAKEEGIPSGTIYNWRVKANRNYSPHSSTFPSQSHLNGNQRINAVVCHRL
jgi:transposase-like protein